MQINVIDFSMKIATNYASDWKKKKKGIVIEQYAIWQRFPQGDFFSSGQICKGIAEHRWEVIQQNIPFVNGY